jgi:histidine triad (HIT) family protein
MVESPVAECVFCGIETGLVYEGPRVIAFLDHRPLFPGHVLVAPRAHVETLADLPGPDVGPYFTVVQRVSGAVERAMGAGGTFIAINNRVSQSVPHLHCHVVPRTKGDGLRGFFWPRQRYESNEEMARVADAIAAELR